MLYIVCATVVVRQDDGWNLEYPIPTFVLDSNYQGIEDARHAEDIARHILNPTDDPRVTVYASAVRRD